VPEAARHLALHEDHLIGVTARDRPYVSPEMITKRTWTGPPDEIARRIAAAADAGVTEIAFQPAGPDIPRELGAFMAAVG
jgi:5,10-methylenetetrahydromethanopterin reductase